MIAKVKQLSLLGLLLCLLLGTSTASAASLSFLPAFGAGDRLGEGTSFNAEFMFTGSEYHGSPDPVTEVVVHLPAGVGGSSAGFPTCSESTVDDFGTAGCPPGSLAGPVGSISLDVEGGSSIPGVTERVPETGTIQPVFADKAATSNDFLFDIELPSIRFLAPAHYLEDTPPYGRALRLELPLIETIPGQPFASITALTLTLGASREEAGQLFGSLTIPQECPSSGHFPWAADVTYTTDAKFEEQTHDHTTAETACPAASGKLATTTTLQVSPASPQVDDVVTYTATVTPRTLGASEPGGSVTFLDEGLPMPTCAARPLTAGASAATAICQVSYPVAGSHRLTASYSGDAGYFGSFSAAQAVTVGAVAPAISNPGTPPPVIDVFGRPTISPAQLAVLLRKQLTTFGKAARIGALLKHGGLSLPFTATEAGSVSVQWYYLPKGAKLAKQTKARPALVASGKVTFAGPETSQLKLRLTGAGRRLLRTMRQVRLTTKSVFVATGSTTASATGVVAIRR